VSVQLPTSSSNFGYHELILVLIQDQNDRRSRHNFRAGWLMAAGAPVSFARPCQLVTLQPLSRQAARAGVRVQCVVMSSCMCPRGRQRARRPSGSRRRTARHRLKASATTSVHSSKAIRTCPQKWRSNMVNSSRQPRRPTRSGSLLTILTGSDDEPAASAPTKKAKSGDDSD